MRSIAKWVLMGAVVWSLASWGLVPNGSGQVTLKSLITGAATQLDLALQQALVSSTAPTIDNAGFGGHQVLNLLEGPRGPDYDPKYHVSGDDQLGLIDYATQVKAGLQDPQYAPRFNSTIDNVIAYFNSALDRTQRAVSLTDLGGVQKEMKEAIAFLSAAKGRADDVPALGGILILKAQIGQP